ncbi:MAG: SDR family oxidoreductase [Anaerolineae bacterium]|nr:SDR family oxidoreductase [Anaerolineae bacterium]
MTDFSGKTAIITGAGTGIGRAITLALIARGCAVGLNDINPDRIHTFGEEIASLGGRVMAMQGDVCNRFQASALIETTREKFGRVHYLINTAGVYKSGAVSGVDEWDWRRQLDVNLTGAFFCSQLLGRVMGDEGGGVILNFAQSAKTFDSGIGYIASKGGLIAMSKQLAREFAPKNIRVNLISVGDITDNDLPTPANNYLGRVGTPDDVANMALFLLSERANFITGAVIPVDGGVD